MKKEWSLNGGKAIMNFSVKYCKTDDEVLSSNSFQSVLTQFFKKYAHEYTKNYKILGNVLDAKDLDDRVNKFTRLLKLYTIMDSKEISESYKSLENAYEYRNDIRNLVEEIYTYWRKLERYAIIYDNKSQSGVVGASFKETKASFDNRILSLYRKITNNISMTEPNVFRQVAAGTNVGIVLTEPVWAIPDGYQVLSNVPFIRSMVMEVPLIVYPKKNKRTGFFEETYENPLENATINGDSFFCYPAKVGDLLAFIMVHRDFMTHLISLANLFEMADESEYLGKKPDIVIVMGVEEKDGVKPFDCFYDDKENDIVLGYLSNDEKYDYFGYMKKMVLTCHNVAQINRGNLPIHGAMVNIVLKDGSNANVVIMGDSGAGKSESIEAFRSLAEDHISYMTIVFDDMGKFSNGNGDVKASGTETGAFVRLDDLDAGYAFKELDRAILMNPDKTNARLIIPVSTYEEISKKYPVDFYLYANNYEEVKDGEKAIKYFNNKEEALDVFKSGHRFAKGTTQEVGLTKSYFANPFGPMQRQEQTDKLIDQYFNMLFDKGVKVGELYTQLSIKGNEKVGPEKAALNLFDEINEIYIKKGSKDKTNNK